tara:strand:- start:119 stop:385 length:267 start_codon:yes stop_codon:yes gene_type:complete
MKKIFLIAALCTAFLSCEKSKNDPAPYDCVMPPLVQSGICIDSNLTGNSDECIEIYDPVCGCDGITYDNYCVADSSGVTSYVPGECCD